jgi:site-specific recombinase XerC
MLLVHGKGDNQRLVPLYNQAIEACAQWQKLASAHSSGAPSLGCSTPFATVRRL